MTRSPKLCPRSQLFKRCIVLSARPQLVKRWIALSTGQITIRRISITEINYAICWIVIYLEDSAIQRLNNWGQMNHYPVDKYFETNNCAIHWIVIYQVESIIHLSNNRG